MAIKFFRLFYNNILSICYDTQKNNQDDIIIDFDKYENINIDYKIQKKQDFCNIDNTLLNIKKNDNLSIIETQKQDFCNIDNTLLNIKKNDNLSIIETQKQDYNSLDEYDNSDIGDNYDIVSDFD